jgi:hypothetical protein
MRATYQEITDKMRAAFFDACGEKPEDLPELDARFRSVATELYALFVGQHFCKVEPLHLTVKSDFVQFLVDCQNLFVTAFADHLPCND